MVAMAITDIALLLIMLVGLFRLRHPGNDMFGLAQVLWRQAVIWLVLALVAEVTPVVFIILNLNGIAFQLDLCPISTESRPLWNTSSI